MTLCFAIILTAWQVFLFEICRKKYEEQQRRVEAHVVAQTSESFGDDHVFGSAFPSISLWRLMSKRTNRTITRRSDNRTILAISITSASPILKVATNESKLLCWQSLVGLLDTMLLHLLSRLNLHSKKSMNKHQEKTVRNYKLPPNNKTIIFHNQKQLQSQVSDGKRMGCIVLGMHRSGTSLLTGLLTQGLGYQTGGPLIGPQNDNRKGFFERRDVIRQNKHFLNAAGLDWDSLNLENYSHTHVLQLRTERKVNLKEGRPALMFMILPKNVPWIVKDPRLCLTIQTWLPFLNSQPAIVFTYRHPLQVALSLQRRHKNMTLSHALYLWIVYNVRALQNSAHLCRVVTSNAAILNNPKREIERISTELTNKCGVAPPPQWNLSSSLVDSFVDPTLQHSPAHDFEKESHEYGDATSDIGEQPDKKRSLVTPKEEPDKESVQQKNKNSFAIPAVQNRVNESITREDESEYGVASLAEEKMSRMETEADFDKRAAKRSSIYAQLLDTDYSNYNFSREIFRETERDRDLYKRAMRLYFDLESGEAYAVNYTWPYIL